MRQRDGLISEAIYYVRRPHSPRGPKQRMLYLLKLAVRKYQTVLLVCLTQILLYFLI